MSALGELGKLLQSFSCISAYRELSRTRCKPWDDRELDALEGMKFISFVFTTISQTAFSLLFTFQPDLTGVFLTIAALPTTSFVCMNLGMETFIFLSAFTLAYRCFQIMMAKGGALSLGDYCCIIARKYFRLALPVYLVWLLLWCLQSRIFNGPIWANTNIIYEDCADNWWATLAFVGNLVPAQMEPYTGCMQQAFPLQIDMQLSLIVPPLAILMWRFPVCGNMVCLLLIIFNITFNMAVTY